jgi:hypothetical protein
MLIECYRSQASSAVREQLWSVIQNQDRKRVWISVGIAQLDIYIHESMSVKTLLFLIDPELKRMPARDYIV